MFSIKQIKSNYPNVLVIGYQDMRIKFFTYEEVHTFLDNLYAGLTRGDINTPNYVVTGEDGELITIPGKDLHGYIDSRYKLLYNDFIEIPDIFLSILLVNAAKITALLKPLSSNPLPPLLDHYCFEVKTELYEYGGDKLIAYIKKSEIDSMKSLTDITQIIKGDKPFPSLSMLFSMHDINDFANFFDNPEEVKKSCLKLKKRLFTFHTEGFLGTLSKRHPGLVTFMYEKFHDYLTLQDLVNLRLTCKQDKDLPITNLTPQTLGLS